MAPACSWRSFVVDLADALNVVEGAEVVEAVGHG